MSAAFAEIAFTPTVKAAQERYGSRAALGVFDRADGTRFALTAREASFIAARDSFYQATVSETGWPYVQHRGGPAGFVKVLDERTIGYADFRGNVQYVSTGNLMANDRVALIMVDYASRRRLKIWGRARIVHAAEDPALIERLALPGYRARVERGIVIGVEATDWNCPQHITQRFSQAEVDGLLAALVTENRELQRQLDAARAQAAAPRR